MEQSNRDTLASVSPRAPSYILYVKIMYDLVQVDLDWIPGAH